MEFSGDEHFDIFRRRSGDVSETGDRCIYKAACILCLPDNKCKFESKLVIVVDLEYEVRGGGGCRFGVLGASTKVSTLFSDFALIVEP